MKKLLSLIILSIILGAGIAQAATTSSAKADVAKTTDGYWLKGFSDCYQVQAKIVNIQTGGGLTPHSGNFNHVTTSGQFSGSPTNGTAFNGAVAALRAFGAYFSKKPC